MDKLLLKDIIRIIGSCIGGCFLGALILRWGIKKRKEKSHLSAIPVIDISRLSEGLIKTSGRVTLASQKDIHTPITQKCAVYYNYIIEQKKLHVRYGRDWDIIAEGKDSTNFYLSNNDSSVLINPKAAEVYINNKYEYELELDVEPPPEIRMLLSRHDIDYHGFLGDNKSLRITEYSILPNDEIFVVGMAKKLKNDSKSKYIIKETSAEIPFSITNDPHKEVLGQISFESRLGIYVGIGIILLSFIYTAIKILF